MKAAVHEARDVLGALMDRALGGEEVFLTRHGEVEVQLVPVPGKRKVTGEEIRALLRGEEIDRPDDTPEPTPPPSKPRTVPSAGRGPRGASPEPQPGT